MNKKKNINRLYKSLFIIVIIMSLLNNKSFSQQETKYTRIASVVVDSAQLDAYKAALKEGMSAAVKNEPGVIMLYAVYDKEKPTHVTVFEIYASKEAYQLHIKTAHFLKYKRSVENMVKSLELKDVEEIALEQKPIQ